MAALIYAFYPEVTGVHVVLEVDTLTNDENFLKSDKKNNIDMVTRYGAGNDINVRMVLQLDSYLTHCINLSSFGAIVQD